MITWNFENEEDYWQKWGRFAKNEEDYHQNEEDLPKMRKILNFERKTLIFEEKCWFFLKLYKTGLDKPVFNKNFFEFIF